ncbi:MAG: hypothetical protein CM15mP79_2630 [Methanobacteriota archaeon]|nr:MAG: hypothetical protein CM15mP79_2630 [Euryarchaeota archaeon]
MMPPAVTPVPEAQNPSTAQSTHELHARGIRIDPTMTPGG